MIHRYKRLTKNCDHFQWITIFIQWKMRWSCAITNNYYHKVTPNYCDRCYRLSYKILCQLCILKIHEHAETFEPKQKKREQTKQKLIEEAKSLNTQKTGTNLMVPQRNENEIESYICKRYNNKWDFHSVFVCCVLRLSSWSEVKVFHKSSTVRRQTWA